VQFWNDLTAQATSKREVDSNRFSKALVDRFPDYPVTMIYTIVDAFILYDGSLTISLPRFIEFVLSWGPFSRLIERVTANLIDPASRIQRWYHGSVDRENATKLLTAPNLFLCRRDETGIGKIALHMSVIRSEQMVVKTLSINTCVNGQVECVVKTGQPAQRFATLIELIQQHLGDCTPVSSAWFSAHVSMEEATRTAAHAFSCYGRSAAVVTDSAASKADKPNNTTVVNPSYQSFSDFIATRNIIYDAQSGHKTSNYADSRALTSPAAMAAALALDTSGKLHPPPRRDSTPVVSTPHSDRKYAIRAELVSALQKAREADAVPPISPSQPSYHS